jgi:predicted transcriptional regulator
MDRGEAPMFEVKEAKVYSESINEEGDNDIEDEDELAEDYKEDEIINPSSSIKSISPSYKLGSRDPTPNPELNMNLSRRNSQGTSVSKPGTRSSANSPSRSPKRLRPPIKKPTLKKQSMKNFIPRESTRLKEFDRKIKDIDDKIMFIMKNNKNDIIPIIEKRLSGVREELENKASKLDLKLFVPDITEAIAACREVKREMQIIHDSGLLGETGTKLQEDVSLSTSKLSQLDAKFTWLHQSHKDLIKKMNESMNASQPLMMNPNGENGISDVVFKEIKEETNKLERKLEDLSDNFKHTVNDLKAKISEKVGDKALNELEDTLTTDIDQTIRSKFTTKLYFQNPKYFSYNLIY